MNIKDFGQKIGGARKDLLSKGTADIGDWTADEQRQLVIRDNIWKKPNYQKMKDNGLPIEIVAKVKMIRDAIPTRPTFVTPQTYYDITVFIKKATDEVREFEDFGKLSTYLAQYTECWFHYDFSKVESAVETDLHAVKTFIKEKKFLYTEDEKILADYRIAKGTDCSIEEGYVKVKEVYGASFYKPLFDKEAFTGYGYVIISKPTRKAICCGVESEETAKEIILRTVKNTEKPVSEKKPRKKKAVPPQLVHITRTGINYRNGVPVTTDEMMQTFKFRGGEFGNWQTQQDRQANLDMSYDALRDLAVAIGFAPEQISLGGQLAIAYGSRGRAGSVAHYEPERNVISLTKMKGAGSLAHEWFHALSHYLKVKGVKKYLHDVTDTMKHDTDRNVSNYFKKSQEADRSYIKEAHGYWASDEEMLARAFACYVKDRLEDIGMQSDYLCGHAEVTVKPEGEERKKINAEFDRMFIRLRTDKAI